MAQVDKTSENATLLLAAAYEKGLDAGAVKSRAGHFEVDDEIAKAAGFEVDERGSATKKKAAAKKTAAKSDKE